MAKVQNQKPISEFPKDQLTEVWNMSTNTIQLADKVLFERIAKAKGQIQAVGQNQWSDFEQDNYRLDEFKGGGSRKIFHNDSGWVKIMTNDLFDEIKKRNPPQPNIKTKEGKPYERWRKFLSTESEVKEIVGDKFEDEAVKETKPKAIETEAKAEAKHPAARKTK